MLNWSLIDTILLDMDGTLLDLHYDNHFWLEYLPAEYAAKNGLSIAQARQHLIALFAAQQGTLNWYCVDYWSHALDTDIGQLKHNIAEKIAILPSTLDFLDAAKQSGRHVWLVTNAHHKSLNLKLERTGIDKYFSNIVCSHDYQAPKESPLFWERLNAKHPFNPASSLMVDDSQSVLSAAQHYGIGHILTIAAPDSKRPNREGLSFPALESFNQIMPIPQWKFDNGK